MFLQITYDTSQLSFESQKIHDFIISMKPVLDWWHYLPNVYIVETSTSNEADIANVLISEFEGLRFLITKIDIKSPNGVLPQKAWNWMTTKSNQDRSYLKIKTKQLNEKTKQLKIMSDFLRLSDGSPIVKEKKPMTLADILGKKT